MRILQRLGLPSKSELADADVAAFGKRYERQEKTEQLNINNAAQVEWWNALKISPVLTWKFQVRAQVRISKLEPV